MPLPGISQFLELFNKKDDTPPPAPAKEEVNLYERVLFLHFDSDLPCLILFVCYILSSPLRNLIR